MPHRYPETQQSRVQAESRQAISIFKNLFQESHDGCKFMRSFTFCKVRRSKFLSFSISRRYAAKLFKENYGLFAGESFVRSGRLKGNKNEIERMFVEIVRFIVVSKTFCDKMF